MAKKKQIKYGGKDLYVVSETLNFYFVSKNKDGSKQFPISKMEYAAYNKEK
jgi:hypothetical protein